MANGIDAAIDDLIEAAGIGVPTKRAFEVDVCRRKLDEEIEKAFAEERRHALTWGVD